MIQKLIGKIKGVQKAWGREVAFAAAVLLLTALAFAGGWLAGSRAFTRPPIIINCPALLYDSR